MSNDEWTRPICKTRWVQLGKNDSTHGDPVYKYAVLRKKFQKAAALNIWFDFCFTALQHILCHFGRGQFT